MPFLSGEWWSFWSRAAIPVLVTFTLVFLANLPFRFDTGMMPVAPMLGLMAVYFWGMVRADLMRAPAIFLVGFLQDALSGAPLGLTSLALLLGMAVVGYLHPLLGLLSFANYWIGFAVAALVTSLVGYIGIAIALGGFPDSGPLFSQMFLSILLYPFVAAALMFLYRRISPLAVLA